ncbi:dihydropteroate synthase [Rhodocyclus tenuis]|uniref:dihydropteroate synthase n=2 Tax=Rhodocyclus TaxID=1064 RepID=A0A6L5JY96_RHOTE|nr:dihydropteroate synthase [Rhodocyclus gracilis]MQY51168.1 dihydropteroate synthase [Rhodocyclus gracilis]MRD71946.1 dihydropteroate synthase [Rhodocyclus gracilis]NJA88877.1 dihydropteroate synthase [Rhodocyclus gracilis]
MVQLECGKFSRTIDRPLVMGIVNLTPDSFSGDGVDVARALDKAQEQIEAGADWLDVGAESSRPGAQATPLEEELRRLLPVLERLAGCGVPISVDTYKPPVMRAAIEAGVAMINDIYGLRMPGALEAVADADCAVCVMHMQGEPLSMQQAPVYGDVVAEVRAFLAERVSALTKAGVSHRRIVLDPGFGFGKTLEHNLALMRRLPECVVNELPLLIGVSRKSMLGALCGREVADRGAASVAAALLAAQRGAHFLRVHDVAATRDALAVWQAFKPASADATA